MLLVISCSDQDNDGYELLEIEIVADVVTVNQGSTIAISIFNNDLNIETSASLNVEDVQIGTLTRNSNGTVNTILDDTLIYEAPNDFLGDIHIEYTVCNNETNCDSGDIIITIIQSTNVSVATNFVPYNTLSSYNFFVGTLADLAPNQRVTPYEPISSLFSDYALKERFVYIPQGEKASYVGDHEPLDFPIGSVLIKNFYYNKVLPNETRFIIETRLMFKTPEGWTFGEYFWNDEQSEAFLDTEGDGGFREISWLQEGEVKTLDYRMPSTSECFTCHKNYAQNAPIGVKPQNLNSLFEYEDGTLNQLVKWENLGILESGLPTSITSVVDYSDVSQPLDLRVRSYFDINCASCHSDGGHCDYRSMRFAFNENAQIENLGVCIEPDDRFFELADDQKLIKPGDPENSVLFARINTTQENRRMPLLGRRSIHAEGVQLIEDWIFTLEDCN